MLKSVISITILTDDENVVSWDEDEILRQIQNGDLDGYLKIEVINKPLTADETKAEMSYARPYEADDEDEDEEG